MRRGAKTAMVNYLRVTAETLKGKAEQLEAADDEPFNWSVLWGPDGILLAGRRVTATEVEEIVAGGVWAMFESCRSAADARDPKAFDRVMRRVTELARDRCHQTTQPGGTDR